MTYFGSRIRRSAAGVALGAVLLSSIFAFGAYRRLSARPGETSLRLVPADALGVASFDLSASASQVIAFKQIDDALARNGMGGFAEKSLFDVFFSRYSQRSELAGLRELVLRDGAAALLPGADGTMNGADLVAMLALSDGEKAQGILAKAGAAQFYKGAKYYALAKDEQGFMVVGDVLVVGRPKSLYQVKMVREGAKPALASNAGFVAARSHVADDANVMLFVSPKAMVLGPPNTATTFASDWLSVGLAIRDGGIGLSTSAAADIATNPELAKMSQITPLRADLLKVLPSGAYGVVSLAQPSGYFDAIQPTLNKQADVRKGIGQMEDSLAQATGLDFDKDIRPAFRGDAIVAAYPLPSDSTGPAGADLLVVIDDSNGGDPADALDRFTSHVKAQMEKEGGTQGPLWSDRTANGAHFFRLATQPESDLRKSFSQGMDPQQINKPAFADKKTLAWAVVGKAVIGSTSQDLLDRAVASYQAQGDSLEADAKFGPAAKEALDGSQTLVLFSLARIAEGVKNTVYTTKMNADGRQMFEQIIGAFASLDKPLSLHGGVQPDGRAAGGAFIPLDYDKLIDIAGKAMNKK